MSPRTRGDFRTRGSGLDGWKTRRSLSSFPPIETRTPPVEILRGRMLCDGRPLRFVILLNDHIPTAATHARSRARCNTGKLRGVRLRNRHAAPTPAMVRSRARPATMAAPARRAMLHGPLTIASGSAVVRLAAAMDMKRACDIIAAGDTES